MLVWSPLSGVREPKRPSSKWPRPERWTESDAREDGTREGGSPEGNQRESNSQGAGSERRHPKNAIQRRKQRGRGPEGGRGRGGVGPAWVGWDSPLSSCSVGILHGRSSSDSSEALLLRFFSDLDRPLIPRCCFFTATGAGQPLLAICLSSPGVRAGTNI